MTVDRVVVNLDRTFCPGQGYVALSRVTSKDGLFIETKGPELLQKNYTLTQMSKKHSWKCQN